MASSDDPVATARSLLTNAQLCPGCHGPLSGTVCPRCGLDLSGPQAAEVWRASLDAAAALDARQERLAALYRLRSTAPNLAPPVDLLAVPPALRAEAPVVWTPAAVPPFAPPSPARTAPTAGAAPAAAAGRLSSAGAVASGPAAPAGPVGPADAFVPPGPTRSAPSRNPAGPRRPWTVQTVLQVLGVGLLAAACIVFLVVAWGSFPLGVRAAVVGLATVLVFGLASLLRRRSLPQGAEAVAALAVVLLLLDAWAVRRTGLLGAGPTWAYWSLAFLACAAVLAGWGRTSGLATGHIAAAGVWLAASVPLLAWRPGPVAVGWVALLVTAAAAVRFVPHVVRRDESTRSPGRLVLACGAVGGGVVCATWALVLVLSDPSDRAPAAQLATLAVVAAVTAALAGRSDARGWDRSTAPGWAVATGVAAAAAAASAGAAAALDRQGEGVVALGAAAAAAALLAAVAGALRSGEGLTGRAVVGAQVTAGIGVAAAALAVVILVAQVVPGALRSGDRLAAVAGALAAGALAAGVAGVRRHWTEATRLGVGLAVTAVVALTVAAIASAQRPWLPTLALLALAAAFAAADLLLSSGTDSRPATPRHSWRDGSRGGSITGAVLALGTAVPDRGAAGVALAGLAGVTLVARGWRRDAGAATTCLGTILASGAAGLLLSAAGVDDASATSLAAASGALALCAVTFVVPRAAPQERIASFGCALGLTALGWTVGLSAGVPATAAPLGAAILVLAATLWRGADRVAAAARTQAVAATAPVLALAAPTVRATGWPALSLTAVVLLAAAMGAVQALLAPWVGEHAEAAARPAAELGGAVTLAGAFAAAWLVGPDLAALVLLVAAVTALGVARTADRAPWRWVALGLGATASWVLLGARDVPVAEAYLAPTGAILAAAGARRVRRRGEGGLHLLGAGLALLLLPSAVLPGSILWGGAAVNRMWLTCAAAALLVVVALVASARRGPAVDRSWVWPVAALAAALAVLGPFRNAVTLALGVRAQAPAVPELWALGAVLVLAGAAAVVALGPWPSAAGWWPACLAPALVAATLPSAIAVTPGASGWLRAVAVFAVTGTVAVVGLHAALMDRAGHRGLHGAVGTAAGLATVVTVVAVARLREVPGDVPIVVLGALACVLGVQWLRARPDAGSWRALAPGLVAMLVVPTLVGLGDDTAWRPPSLVVAGVAAVVAGAVLRWQAPFVVGAGVLAVVVVAYLGPWVGTVLAVGGGWPSLAVGGAVLLALGLTYERRLAQAKEAARFVAAMR